MFRKLWLINSKENKYELSELHTNSFLQSPSGFGFSTQFSSVRYGNEEVMVDIQQSLPVVNGELIFRGTLSEKYQEYQNFIQFTKYRPLKLYYQPPNVSSENSWFTECEIQQIDKAEVSPEDSMLHCPIQIYGTSFWKTAQEHDVAVSESYSDGFKYPVSYPTKYEGNNFTNIQVQNNGTIDSGFEFVVNGSIKNPVLSLYQDNEKYGEIRINGEFTKVIVDTKDSEESIILELNGSVLANPTQYFDLSSNGEYITPFPKLRVGDNVLTFSYGGTFEDEIHIKWRDLYGTI